MIFGCFVNDQICGYPSLLDRNDEDSMQDSALGLSYCVNRNDCDRTDALRNPL